LKFDNHRIYTEIDNARKSGKSFVIATVVRKAGSGPAEPGRKMLIFSDRKIVGSIGGGALENMVIKDGLNIIADGKPELKKYILQEEGEKTNTDSSDIRETGMICGGEVWIFFENITPEEKIYIFGGGHIGKSLVYHLRNCAFSIIVIDSREKILHEITDVQKLLVSDYEKIFEDVSPPAGCYFIIATYSHELDYKILRKLYRLNLQPKYIGLVASKRKITTMLDRLKEDLDFNPNLDTLYSPAGLDIGGESPDEIAISIVSEIQAIRYGKTKNVHLRII